MPATTFVAQQPETRSRAREAAHRLFPWLALAAVWVFFELPTVLRPGAIEPSAMRPSLDVLALLTAWGVSHRHGRGVWARRGLLAITALLVAFRLDQMVFKLLMRDEPLLYDQWFMVRHLMVLISDLMSAKTVLVLGSVLGTIAALVAAGRWLLARAHVLVSAPYVRTTARVNLALWVLALGAQVASPRGERAWVRWVTPSLVDNVRESVATYRSIQHGLEQSPYAHYADVKLEDKPDVLLFIVESYGKLLSTHDAMRGRHEVLLERLATRLDAAGWHMASAFSTSSVSGGRSWLAEGTIMMGTPIKYEAVFQHLVSKQPPSFPRFLARQGYETVLLAPADRNRPGARVANRYDFSRVLSNESVGYRGPAMGWGIVPDQYSLHVAERKVLANRTKPVFLDFHMVTSHAPWNAVPPTVSDPSSLNDLTVRYGTVVESNDGKAQVLKRLSRYEHDDDGRFAYMNQLTEPMRRGYQATITYDLQILTRYLESRRDDALVIILGDHQPPVITRADASFDTPVHVLSRNPKRLEELMRNGFVRGLVIPPEQRAVISHAGLFSLFVRTLSSASPSLALAPVLSGGHALLAH